MKDPRKIVLVSTIIILIVMFATTFIRESLKKRNVQPVDTSNTQPTVMRDDYSDWTLFRNGYAFPLPADWKNTSDTGGTAVLEPGQPIGSIENISVTVLSDKKAPEGQRFTTQKELDEWSAVTGEVQGTIQKPKNITLDGEQGVMLFDTTKGEDKWLSIIWARKDSINIYLTFRGNRTYGDADEKAIDYIVSHFTFTPPAMTGDEGKK